MDVERVIEFILDQQAKNEVQFAQTESQIATIFGVLGQFSGVPGQISGQIGAIAAVQLRINEALEGLTVSHALTEQTVRELGGRLNDLAATQAVTEKKLQGLIDALARGRNGHQN